MEYFDMRKMSVNLWRNAAGETREICTFPPAKRDFYWRASITSIAANGEFSLFPGMERIVTLLEGGEMFLESADRFNHTLKPLQPFSFAADLVVKAKLTAGQMSMDIACWASVSAGSVWRTSPIDDVLTIRTRIRQASSCNNSALSSSSTRWGVMSIKLW